MPKFRSSREGVQKSIRKFVNQPRVSIPLPLGSSSGSPVYLRLFDLCAKPPPHVFNFPLSRPGLPSTVALFPRLHCPPYHTLARPLALPRRSRTPLRDDLSFHSSQPCSAYRQSSFTSCHFHSGREPVTTGPLPLLWKRKRFPHLMERTAHCLRLGLVCFVC